MKMLEIANNMFKKTCFLCDTPITDKQYMYKWFSKEGGFKMIHPYHMQYGANSSAARSPHQIYEQLVHQSVVTSDGGRPTDETS